MKNVVLAVMSIVFGVIVMVLVVLCMMTPEKTKDGHYTNGYRYWTDEVYFSENFNYGGNGHAK